MGMYEFSADISDIQIQEEKWSFAIPHDEFWEKFGITSDTDLSDVEEYEIE